MRTSKEAQVESILVRSPNWLGDQILALPFFYFLRKMYPRATITVVCVEWVASLQYRNWVDHVEVIERSLSPAWLDKLSVIEKCAKKLRASKQGRYDLAFSLPNSISAAWLLLRSNSVRRRGYAGDGRSVLLTEVLSRHSIEGIHRAQAYLNLLTPEFKSFGKRVPDVQKFWGDWPDSEEQTDGVPPEWEKRAGELDFFDFEKAWNSNPVSTQNFVHSNEKFWIIAPGATADSRRWGVQNFIKLAQLVYEKKQWKLYVVGGAAETPIAQEILNNAQVPSVDFTAQGTAADLAYLFRGAEVSVCNESGLAHVAALCGSPVHIVCGAADPRRTKPLGPGAVQVTVNPIECWPCERNTCPLQGPDVNRCLKGISAHQVWEEIALGIGKESGKLN